MKSVLKKVLSHHVFEDKPPVLLDIGASGQIHKEWKTIAPFAICIAFDADDRDFSIVQEGHQKYRKLYLLNHLVSDVSSKKNSFYLTCAPHCSSALKPNSDALADWAFDGLFKVEKEVAIPSISIAEALEKCHINYIDWYKSDSQGTDLRIFASLDDEIIDQTILAEFEPGIMDAYVNEDKIFSIMEFMQKRPFWVQNMKLKGSQRVSGDARNSLSKIQHRFLHIFVPTSPGWCEITFFNNSRQFSDLRSFLLAWVFAMQKGEYGFALDLAMRMHESFEDEITTTVWRTTRSEMRKRYGMLLIHLPKQFLVRTFRFLRFF